MHPAPLKSATPETIPYPLIRLLPTVLPHKLPAGDYVPRQYPPTLAHRVDLDKQGPKSSSYAWSFLQQVEQTARLSLRAV